MSASAPKSLLPARALIFRRYLTFRNRIQGLRLTAEAIQEARQRRQQARHDQRMVNFYSWCEACRGLGSIF
ncbi:hypothetical protein [Hymenobacter psychrophilus]|uniref:Uncharacterized protein n=1 Tax=Hymenobacter psychrophilus TaxID=651662 RepID=A0A1H3J1T7_9BACT|nr:hypothetical protein [Hymenobacter psychrophilus]SDY33970.1 hypothetical protein SAMN04488069_107254 [Hymenobacter psychrophilus]